MEYGNWHRIYTRYKRWSEKGFFYNLLSKLQNAKEVIMDVVFVDSSIVPLHYRKRHIIERFFGRLKENKRIATRFDKLDSSFISFIAIATAKLYNLFC